MMSEKGLFIVVSAPSGAGKSSICQRLLQACPELKFSVSYTSRPPRPNEINGKDYYFISHDEFQRRIDQNEFVEWIENYGHLYGTSIKAMEDFPQKGKDLSLIHISEPTRLGMISYAVFCLKKKTPQPQY